MHFVGIPTLIIFSFATKFWLFLILVSNSLYFSSNFEFGTIHRWFDDPFWPTLLFNESSYNPSTNTSMQSIIWWNLSLINSYLYQSSYSKCRNIVLLLLSVIFPYNSTLNSASPVWLLKRGLFCLSSVSAWHTVYLFVSVNLWSIAAISALAVLSICILILRQWLYIRNTLRSHFRIQEKYLYCVCAGGVKAAKRGDFIRINPAFKSYISRLYFKQALARIRCYYNFIISRLRCGNHNLSVIIVLNGCSSAVTCNIAQQPDFHILHHIAAPHRDGLLPCNMVLLHQAVSWCQGQNPFRMTRSADSDLLR